MYGNLQNIFKMDSYGLMNLLLILILKKYIMISKTYNTIYIKMEPISDKFFQQSIDRFNNIKSKIIECEKCNITDVNCEIHCLVCSEEKCYKHIFENMTNISDSRYSHGYYIFLININNNIYDQMPTFIEGKIISNINKHDKKASYYKDVIVKLHIDKQINLGKCLEYIQNTILNKTFMKSVKGEKNVKNDNFNGKTFKELINNISRYENNTCYEDEVTKEIKIYLDDKSHKSILNFKYGDNKYKQIQLNSFINVFKSLDEDTQNCFRILNVDGCIFPYKISFKTDDSDMKIKTSWTLRVTVYLDEGVTLAKNNPQKHFEKNINTEDCLMKLSEIIESYEANNKLSDN
jgi:hypothetical protein